MTIRENNIIPNEILLEIEDEEREEREIKEINEVLDASYDEKNKCKKSLIYLTIFSIASITLLIYSIINYIGINKFSIEKLCITGSFSILTIFLIFTLILRIAKIYLMNKSIKELNSVLKKYY